jgi:phosphonate transport system permease protein
MSERDASIRELRARRPVNWFLRASLALLGLLVVYAWFSGEFGNDGVLGERAGRNVARFMDEVQPYPTRADGWDWGVVADWAGELMETVPPEERGGRWRPGDGWEATWKTLAISVVAIVLAGIGALLLSLPAASNIATPEPFLPGPKPPSALRRGFWGTTRWLARVFLIFLRAIPEYIWAFLLIGILGLSAWPAVLALALHNAGIMGEIAAFGVYPVALPRWLLYFFYRWETCVREATVLGMLGVTTLGALINESRVRDRYDDMLFYVLLGAVLVLVGDLLSAVARSLVRRAS